MLDRRCAWVYLSSTATGRQMPHQKWSLHDSAHHRHRRHRRHCHGDRRHLQQPRHPAQSRRQRLAKHRHAAPAPQRPHPQRGRNGQGLRRARAGDPRRRHRRPHRRDLRGDARREDGRRQRAHRRPAPVAHGCRGLPRPQGEHQLHPTPGHAPGDRGQDLLRPPSYNDCVLNYNNGIQTFPGNIFAGIFQFKPRTGFEAAEAAREAPQVKF